MSEKIQAVIFDQDGLMFDTEALAARSWFEVGPKYGIHTDHEFLRGIRGCKPDKTRQACMERYGELPFYDRFREEKRQYSYRWIREHGVPVKRGLKELLAYLKEHGIKTAVATASSEEWTRGNVKDAGVAEYFDEYIYGDMVAEAKPNPAIFLLAAGRLGVEPCRCVVLEDSFNGIRAAAAGGFVPVMVPDQDQPDEEIRGLYTACCDSLLDVIRLFEDGILTLESHGARD